MKNILLGALFVVLALGLVSAANAQVHVTFILNTCTMPDTINPSSPVNVTGGGTGAADLALTQWGVGVPFTNIGGDYWTATITVNAGDVMHYKFRLGQNGWEENTNDPMSTNNHDFTAPSADTVLPVQYWNNGHFAAGKNPPSFTPPWSAVSDSFMNVYFRVDMHGYAQTATFNTATDTPSVRGGFRGTPDENTVPPDFGWGTSFYLTQETAPTNSAAAFSEAPGWFWSGRVRIPKDSIWSNPGRFNGLGFKFIINGDWGRADFNDRYIPLPVDLKDTTIQYMYFRDAYPSARVNVDTVYVHYLVNLKKALNTGGFVPGDTVNIHTGYFGTSTNLGATGKAVGQFAGSIYTLDDTVITARGQTLDYQYYHVKNTQEVRENYFNFNYDGPTVSEAEKRQVTVPVSGDLFIYDTAASVLKQNRQPDFPNSLPLQNNVTVTWELNLKPAMYQVKYGGSTLVDIQGSDSVYPAIADSIVSLGVWMNGPALGGWTGWGNTLRTTAYQKMWDDGTHGDLVAGDSIFTLTYSYGPDSANNLGQYGQVYKFGIHGGDNEAGSTKGFGNNHQVNISDQSPTYLVHTQWGSINPLYYTMWNYDAESPITGIKDKAGIPLVFKLEQNYPNPFNPSTRIEYSIPKQAMVNMKVYNILGQEVGSLVNEVKNAGNYVVVFDASKLASGVYFYKLTAGNFVSTKKMLLMK